jgi:hypothetical protein
MSESVSVESKEPAPQKPALSVGRIAGEILAGMGVGFAAGLPPAFGFLLWMGPILAARDCFGAGGIAALFVSLFFVFPMAYGLASGVGVYLVGRIGKQTGSFLLTLGCAFAGGLAVMGMGMPMWLRMPMGMRNTRGVPWLSWLASMPYWASVPLALLLPPLMATCAFNWTRRYKQPVSPRSSS